LITNPETAKAVLAELHAATTILDSSVALELDRCPEAEFRAYRHAVALVLGELWEVVHPLYRSHPSLAPEGYFAEPSSPSM
jgi:hypothetical protein